MVADRDTLMHMDRKYEVVWRNIVSYARLEIF